VKVPMQFLILLIGALVFVFYMYFRSPIFFNQGQLNKVYRTEYGTELKGLEQRYDQLSSAKQQQVKVLASALEGKDEGRIRLAQDALRQTETAAEGLRTQARKLIKQADPAADDNDTNYIFLHFVVNNLPKGLVGLLIAIIFLASWGSIAAALNSLASTTIVDVYKRMINKDDSDAHYLKVSRWWTLIWGIFCIMVAQFASELGSLIEAVNVLGSLFYGVILGIFMVAFYIRKLGGNATFWSAIVSEVLVITIYKMEIVSFLWLNVIGCVLVVLLAFIIHLFTKKEDSSATINLPE